MKRLDIGDNVAVVLAGFAAVLDYAVYTFGPANNAANCQATPTTIQQQK